MGIHTDITTQGRGAQEWPLVVQVRDDAHSGLVASFAYSLEEGSLQVRRVAVHLEPGGTTRDEISVKDIRVHLPWGLWESAARAKVIEHHNSQASRESTREPSGQKASGRLLAVADQYRENLRQGVRNPVKAIAEAHGVKPDTARTWIHRARRRGYLGPAVGPTPGEKGFILVCDVCGRRATQTITLKRGLKGKPMTRDLCEDHFAELQLGAGKVKSKEPQK